MKKSSILVILLSSVLFACTNSTDKQQLNAKTSKPLDSLTSSIHPVKGLEIASKVFKVAANQGKSIQLENGGSIVIPENAFVNKEGKPISGQVDLLWNEYHSLTDIMFSGIPMRYDSAGVNYDFVSGGMFAINAQQNGEELFLAKGKNVEVNVASQNPQEQFNFYSLDEGIGKWKYLTTLNAEPAVEELEKVAVPVKKANTWKAPTRFMQISHLKNWKDFKELKKEEIIGWNVDTSALTKKDYLDLQKGNVNVKILSKKDDLVYSLELKTDKKNVVVDAMPITFENNSQEKLVDKAYADRYGKQFKKMNDLAAKGTLIRSIQISSFGIYNWDCCYMEATEDFAVDLAIPGSDQTFNSYFFVSPIDKRIIPISATSVIHLGKKPSCIIGLNLDGEVFCVRDKDLRNGSNNKGNTIPYTMTSLNKRIKNPSEMTPLINSCI